jgi:hypothetical protein
MGICKQRQFSTMERMAAIRGPASWLPKWIHFLRLCATRRMTFSAALVLKLKDRMIQEASEPMPQCQRVVASFGQSALWVSLATSGFDLALDRFQDWPRSLLT